MKSKKMLTSSDLHWRRVICHLGFPIQLMDQENYLLVTAPFVNAAFGHLEFDSYCLKTVFAV